MISLNPHTGAVSGSLHTEDGRSFALEKCGSSYIFEEFDLTSLPPEEDFVDSTAAEVETDSYPSPTETKAPRSYSVMVYYTPEFAAATTDIADWLDLLMAETNQGQTCERCLTRRRLTLARTLSKGSQRIFTSFLTRHRSQA